ncbi:MAG: hypothetical protein CMJ56_03695, partial [Planctomycetaceae bacterium]|nr:hypothetical protein [Planctomycetaceae bacterium]
KNVMKQSVNMQKQLLDIPQENQLSRKLRRTLAWNIVTSTVHQSRFRFGLVLVLSIIFWAAVFCLFYDAFSFIDSMHAEVMSLLFNTFFSALMVMMTFSTGILMYGGLYRSGESSFLLTCPLRAETIHAHKFTEAFWFSSWGFILLGSPMLIAYGIVRDAPWSFFLMIVPFIVTFVVIPASIGSILCMLVVAGLPRLRLHALSISFALVAVGIFWISWSTFSSTKSQLLTTAWFEETLSRLAMTEQVFLPSWWLASGLLDAALRGESPDLTNQSTREALKFLGLILANALLLSLIASWVARWTYRKGYSNLQAEVPIRKRRQLFWLDELLTRGGSNVGNPIRLLLVKDLQIFRRDVTQWSQFIIFFGLLGLYFYNLRSFNYSHVYASLIGHLNLAVVGLIFSTFTTRFVFPSISLEGRRFWILGLLPIDRDQIVLSKFFFSFAGGLIPCLGLILLSDSMLGLPWSTIFIHLMCSLALCSGLSGIAVGMGASIPNFRESSPAKIAAGFGGTLSLVLSAMFIILLVVTVGFTHHFNLLQQTLGQVPLDTASQLLGSSGGQVVSLCIIIAGGLLATFLPLILGIRAFRQLEP